MTQKILLIEDEDLIRDLYRDLLEAAGFSVDAFATGEKGLEALYKNTYNLVLLDIVLQDVNGLDILKRIKKDDKVKNVPVVLLTNLDQDLIIRQGFELGAAGYLMKVSLTPDQVVEEVKRIFHQTEQK